MVGVVNLGDEIRDRQLQAVGEEALRLAFGARPSFGPR